MYVKEYSIVDISVLGKAVKDIMKYSNASAPGIMLLFTAGCELSEKRVDLITGQAELFWIAAGNEDSSLRLSAAARIEDEALLEEINGRQ